MRGMTVYRWFDSCNPGTDFFQTSSRCFAVHVVRTEPQSADTPRLRDNAREWGRLMWGLKNMDYKSFIVSVILTANWLTCLAFIIRICYSIKRSYERTLDNWVHYYPWICYFRKLFAMTTVLICIYFTSDNVACRGQSSQDAPCDAHFNFRQAEVQDAEHQLDKNEKQLKIEQLDNVEKKLNKLEKDLANVITQLEIVEKQLELTEQQLESTRKIQENMGNELENMTSQLGVMTQLLHAAISNWSAIFVFQFLPIAGLLVILVLLLFTLVIQLKLLQKAQGLRQ